MVAIQEETLSTRVKIVNCDSATRGTTVSTVMSIPTSPNHSSVTPVVITSALTMRLSRSVTNAVGSIAASMPSEDLVGVGRLGTETKSSFVGNMEESGSGLRMRLEDLQTMTRTGIPLRMRRIKIRYRSMPTGAARTERSCTLRKPTTTTTGTQPTVEEGLNTLD